MNAQCIRTVLLFPTVLNHWLRRFSVKHLLYVSAALIVDIFISLQSCPVGF